MVSTTISPTAEHRSASVGAPTYLIEVESMLRIAARKLEWLAVAEPDLSREAKIVFLAAQRVRARRLAAA